MKRKNVSNNKKSKIERSSGGLVVCRYKDQWWLLIMKDKSGKWTFPKGKIESGEDEQSAAVREIAEEVGITGLSYIAALKPSLYWYFRDGSVRKHVQYFLFQVARRHTPVVQKEEGITQAKWVKLSFAGRIIGYPKTNPQLLTEAVEMLKDNKEIL